MIWSTIQGAKSGKHDLEVVWLDLANAYGSVPHSVIEYAMQHYWVPDRLRKIVQEYYHKFDRDFQPSISQLSGSPWMSAFHWGVQSHRFCLCWSWR